VTSTRNTRRLRTAIIFAAARGAATAAGSFPIALTLWWLPITAPTCSPASKPPLSHSCPKVRLVTQSRTQARLAQ
jgi:hypothetical protein